MNRKSLALLLALALLFCLFGGSAVTAAGYDYAGHWAAGQIDQWLRQGLVNGYADGSFRPDNNITRAEFFALINRIFGFEDTVPIIFKDVPSHAWYAEAISKAVAAGYVSGYEDGTIRPNNPITRQEAAKVIAEAFKYKGSEPGRGFVDADQISSWARNYVNIMTSKGIITGYPDGSFGPNRNLTRAETVAMLERAAGDIYNQAGTYSKDAYGNVIVNTPGVTLERMIINGDLILAEGIGQGDVILDNVKVLGNTFVRGGGSDSIILKNSELHNLVVQKKDGKVRVVATGSTKVINTTLETGGKLETQALSGSDTGFQNVTIPEQVAGNDHIVLEGNFGNVIIQAPDMIVEIASGTNVSAIHVNANTLVLLAEGANVQVVRVSGTADHVVLEGNGTIGAVQAENKNAVKQDGNIKVGTGTSSSQEPSTDRKGSGGSSGGSRPREVRVSRVELNKNELRLTVGQNEKLVASVLPANATNKKVSWTSSNELVATVDQNGVVKAVAPGTAIITATSVSNSNAKDTCVVTVIAEEPVVPKPTLEVTGPEEVPADAKDFTVTFVATHDKELAY